MDATTAVTAITRGMRVKRRCCEDMSRVLFLSTSLTTAPPTLAAWRPVDHTCDVLDNCQCTARVPHVHLRVDVHVTSSSSTQRASGMGTLARWMASATCCGLRTPTMTEVTAG